MTDYRIIVATFPDQPALAAALIERLQRAWLGPVPPQFTATGGDELDAEVLESFDTVIIAGERGPDTTSLSYLVTLLQESRLGVLAMLGHPPPAGGLLDYAGALTLALANDDAVLAAALQGVCHRQREVRELEGEMALVQRHHGGLKGQMAKVHEELQLAAMVQQEFLPRELPTLHGMQFSAMWRPAHYVSGDLYDVIRLDEDHVGMFIADAVGHGVPAALMSMIICRSLSVKDVVGSDYQVVSPSQVLARLNADMVHRQGRTTRFATAVYAVVDCRRRRMTIAGAGHPPPILLRGDGSTERIVTSGGLLGVFADEQFEETQIDLAMNDRVVLFSDGFEQAFPEQGVAAVDHRKPTTRYLDEFTATRNAVSSQAMIEQVAARLDGQSGSLHQNDDLTLLCMLAGEAAEQRAAA